LETCEALTAFIVTACARASEQTPVINAKINTIDLMFMPTSAAGPLVGLPTRLAQGLVTVSVIGSEASSMRENLWQKKDGAMRKHSIARTTRDIKRA
jgi:hypothetical protein